MTAQDDWQFVPRELDDVLSGIGHNLLLGHRYNAHGAGWIELAMPWQDRLAAEDTERGFSQGPIVALLDNAAGVAVWLRRGGYLPQVTVDLRVDYLRPTQPGATLISRCECYKLTPSIGFSRGVAYEMSPDDPACHVAAAFMLL